VDADALLQTRRGSLRRWSERIRGRRDRGSLGRDTRGEGDGNLLPDSTSPSSILNPGPFIRPFAAKTVRKRAVKRERNASRYCVLGGDSVGERWRPKTNGEKFMHSLSGTREAASSGGLGARG